MISDLLYRKKIGTPLLLRQIH